VEHGQEIAFQLFVSRCQPPHVFHSAEEPLDQVSHRINAGIMRDRHFGVRFRWDHGHRALIGDGLADRGAAIGFVRDDCQGRGLPVQKRTKRFAIMGLCAGDVDPQRTAKVVYSGVNLTTATAA